MATAAPPPLIRATVLQADGAGRPRCPQQFEVFNFTVQNVMPDAAYIITYQKENGMALTNSSRLKQSWSQTYILCGCGDGSTHHGMVNALN